MDPDTFMGSSVPNYDVALHNMKELTDRDRDVTTPVLLDFFFYQLVFRSLFMKNNNEHRTFFGGGCTSLYNLPNKIENKSEDRCTRGHKTPLYPCRVTEGFLPTPHLVLLFDMD
jgi:hypothetical protein